MAHKQRVVLQIIHKDIGGQSTVQMAIVGIIRHSHLQFRKHSLYKYDFDENTPGWNVTHLDSIQKWDR